MQCITAQFTGKGDQAVVVFLQSSLKWLVLLNLLVGLSFVPCSKAHADEEPAKVEDVVDQIKKKFGQQIDLINASLNDVEMMDHGRLIFLRETCRTILETIQKGNILKVKEQEFISAFRKFKNAEETLKKLAPRVLKQNFNELFALAQQWADLREISEKAEEEKHLYDTLLVAEQSLSRLHETVQSVALSSSTEDRAKMEKVAQALADVMSKISKNKGKALASGDTVEALLEVGVPIIYDIRRIGEELVSLDPLQKGEVGTSLFVMLGTVDNLVDTKRLEGKLQEYDVKVRGNTK